jgi:hypothetical protein
MIRRKRVEITVETRRLVVRRGMSQAPDWCAECSAPVQSVTPGEAAALPGVSTGTVYCRAEAGRLHFVETAARSPMICLNSLLRSTGEGGDDHAAGHAADHRNHE